MSLKSSSSSIGIMMNASAYQLLPTSMLGTSTVGQSSNGTLSGVKGEVEAGAGGGVDGIMNIGMGMGVMSMNGSSFSSSSPSSFIPVSTMSMPYNNQNGNNNINNSAFATNKDAMMNAPTQMPLHFGQMDVAKNMSYGNVLQQGRSMSPPAMGQAPTQMAAQQQQLLMQRALQSNPQLDKARVALLLDINVELLRETVNIQNMGRTSTPSDGIGTQSSESAKDPVNDKKYQECIKRLQANLAYLAAIADRSHRPMAQIPASPAILSAPQELPGLQEAYQRLQTLFPGIKPGTGMAATLGGGAAQNQASLLHARTASHPMNANMPLNAQGYLAQKPGTESSGNAQQRPVQNQDFNMQNFQQNSNFNTQRSNTPQAQTQDANMDASKHGRGPNDAKDRAGYASPALTGPSPDVRDGTQVSNQDGSNGSVMSAEHATPQPGIATLNRPPLGYQQAQAFQQRSQAQSMLPGQHSSMFNQAQMMQQPNSRDLQAMMTGQSTMSMAPQQAVLTAQANPYVQAQQYLQSSNKLFDPAMAQLRMQQMQRNQAPPQQMVQRNTSDDGSSKNEQSYQMPGLVPDPTLNFVPGGSSWDFTSTGLGMQ